MRLLFSPPLPTLGYATGGDAQYTFWLKSLYYCNVAAPEKSNNLEARSLQNQFVTNVYIKPMY